MASSSYVRFIFCWIAVITLHVLVIFLIFLKNNSFTTTKSTQSYLHYISVVSPPIPETVRPTQSNNETKPQARVSVLPRAPTASPNSDAVSDLTLSPAPRLDLNTLRASAVQHELSRERSSIELQREKNHQNQSVEAHLDRGAKQAEHTDCKTAYAQTGLLAPIFIAADLIRDKGCKF